MPEARLRARCYTGNGTAANPSLAYGYDKAGNRSSGTENGATVSSTVATTSNRLTAVGGPQQRSLTYNLLGQLESEIRWDGNRSYSYDALERLSHISINGATVGQYWNNALSQRAMKRTGSVDTRFVYGQGGELLSEVSGANTTNHIWLFGQPLAVVKNGSLYYVHGDQLGRPEVLSTPSRGIAWRANLSGWNRSVAVDQVGGYHLGYPGQYFDSESGLWQNWHRYYDGQLGRYITSDPIGLAGGINTYAYVGGNPVSSIDSTGLFANLAIRGGLQLAFRMGMAQGLQSSIRSAAMRYGAPGMAAACALAGVCTFANNSNPLEGEPGSEETCENKKGNKKQTRRYGADGFPDVDTDWDHPHGGLGAPHVHDWGRPPNGGRPTADDRGPGRLPKPGDPGF